MTNEADARRVVILDGRGDGDASVLGTFCETLKASGAQFQIFPLRTMKLAHCIGCFGCWMETPGVCGHGEGVREIIEAVVRSGMLVLFTPVTFGGYSPELKLMVDHFIQLILPEFITFHGEMHHPSRYRPLPRLVAVGIQSQVNEEEARIFKTLVGRNALNLHAATYAAEVVAAQDGDDAAALVHRFQALLSRVDAWPLRGAMTSLMPSPLGARIPVAESGARRALLIVGSPKVKKPSTSGVLGGYLLEQLKHYGWESQSWALRAGLRKEAEQARLLAEVDGADLLILAFPLYADSPPFLVTKALQLIADHRQAAHRAGNPERRPQSLAVLVNNGFIDAYHNHVAVAICHQFAEQNGITWAGALAMGSGEAISSGRALRPPRAKYAIKALDLAGKALSDGHPVPAEAVTLMGRSPLPTLLWRGLFTLVGTWTFRREASAKGLNGSRLREQPYALEGD